MREIDKAFLKIFKDLKITLDKQTSTEDNPRYICFIGKNHIKNADVVKMVKEYQDEIIKMLLEESSSEE